MFSKTPLAWLQLSREKVRLAVAMTGIAFSNIVMFMQLGFEGALYDSNVRVHSSLKGDLIMISPRSESLAYMRQFSWRRLYQSLSVREVESVSPLYVGFADWKNPEEKNYRAILVFGFQLNKPVFNLIGVNQNLNKLKKYNNILFDRTARTEYGPIAQKVEKDKVVVSELSDLRVKTVGLFTLGPSFAADGNVVTSEESFLRLFKTRNQGEIDIGIITLKPGFASEEVLKKLAAKLPEDVRLLTYEEFIEFEKEYWRTSSPIGFIFALGTTMGFIVGTAIVYQILYAEVSEHLPEYAALKAIGYSDRYFLGIIFQQALILAILGYIPGLGISLGLYQLTRSATLLPMTMNIARGIFVLFLSIFMCFISGAIAINKLREADPADIF
ncbi:ABC transporter permease DevC [Mastigocoleus testarum]|uniref:ABC transporter n=1 Tax=Mastigocoleus testarum BC008 TaxID=371196 RepID=A0A0V7ZD59_9CYAN|nr:ABC transporter permease DevC [Mastigocoleus testarum]KST62484.1 ABC transporter [Mastigocoleus testarum BC008]